MLRTRFHNAVLRGLLAGAVAALASTGAHAAVVVSSRGFEPTAYHTGSLEGQDSWFNAGSGGTTAVVVQDEVVGYGSQAVKLTRASNSNRYFGRFVNSPPTGRYVSVDWDMRFEATGSTTAYGPFFGVQSFFETSGVVGFVAGFGIDASTGELLYQQGGSGAFLAGPVVPADTWAHYRIDFDFGTDTYKSYYNGQLIATTGFVDDYLGINRLTDVDMVALPASGDSGSGAQTGAAYFDNFVVRDGVRGDYNSDGVVNAADYTVWRDTLNQSGFDLAADGDSDGVVGPADYQIWKLAYGTSNAVGSAVAVPEPAAATLLLVAAAASIGRRRAA